MKILDLSVVSESDAITEAIAVLRRGGMIIYPTETTYGLGVDATNQQAVDKLLKFKGQRGLKPISVAVANQEMAERFVALNVVAKNLYNKFLPGPLTVVSKINIDKSAFSGSSLARGVVSLDGTLGMRIPNHSVAIRLIEQFGKPLTATSANISGARHPWSLSDIRETTPENKLALVDLFLNVGELPKHRPSTIVNTANEQTEIVREGELEISNFKFQISNSDAEIFTSGSENETKQIAENALKQNISFPLIFILSGPLGAGKTVFAKGIAQALGITDPVRSPSYQLVREYRIPDIRYQKSDIRNPSSDIRYPIFYHIDAWRLSSKEEFQDLRLNEMLTGKHVVAIEWPERLVSILPEFQKKATVVFVKIEVVDDQQRRIKISK